jgi:hypothetical protein
VPYARSLTRVLNRHLGWHRARLKFIARSTLGLLRLTTCNLRRLALALKDGVKPASSHRRIQRFLAGYDLDFVALGKLMVHWRFLMVHWRFHMVHWRFHMVHWRFLMVHWRFHIATLPQKPPYLVVVDRTQAMRYRLWHFGSTPVNVLVIGIAQDGGPRAPGARQKGVALPVAWMALPKAGSSSGAEQMQVLRRFLQIAAPEDIEAVLANREFISAKAMTHRQWLEALAERDVPFVVRLRRNWRVGWAHGSPTLPVRLWLRGLDPGQTRLVGPGGAHPDGACSWWLRGQGGESGAHAACGAAAR